MAKPRTPLLAAGIAALPTDRIIGRTGGRAGGRAGGMFPSGSAATDATFWAVLGVLLVATILLVGFITYNRRRAGRSGAGMTAEVSGAEEPGLPELEAEAARLLTETDEAVKAGERELDSVIARYGRDGASYATSTLAEAKRYLAEALRLRGRLEAQATLAEPELRQILRQVIRECGEAHAALEAHWAAVEQLGEQ